MSAHSLLARLKTELAARAQTGLRRELVSVSERRGTMIRYAEQWLLDFSSNDYLGLARSHAFTRVYSTTGSGASRLVTGTSASLLEAERHLAQFFGYESCLTFSSGFLANLTLISTLFSAQDILLADKRVHTSTMAGIRHSRAELHTFRHNRLSHLRDLLARYPAQAVLTESLFSMDGDSPDVQTLGELKKHAAFLAILDEAHAFGVLGENGQGLAHGVADIAIGTLGKAFGLFGAFVLAPGTVRDYLVNLGQGFIYTTALPAWHGDMILDSLERVATAHAARSRLRETGHFTRDLLRDAGLTVRGAAHILAVDIGDERRCTAIAHALRRKGILLFAARYPTVPQGQAILRICLSSLHTERDILRLRDALTSAMREEFPS